MKIKAFSSLYGSKDIVFEYESDKVPRIGEHLSTMRTSRVEEANIYEVREVVRGLNICPSTSELKEDSLIIVVRG